MILNILGFRIAGQISRRKTKPLKQEENCILFNKIRELMKHCVVFKNLS